MPSPESTGKPSTFTGPSRVLRFTASVGGVTRLVALVRYIDAPVLGKKAQVLLWNPVRS